MIARTRKQPKTFIIFMESGIILLVAFYSYSLIRAICEQLSGPETPIQHNIIMYTPRAGVSSCSSINTLPDRNWPGKYNNDVLSNRIRNFNNFLGIFVRYETYFTKYWQSAYQHK